MSLLVRVPSLGQHSLSWSAFPLLVRIPLRLSSSRGLTACVLRRRGVALHNVTFYCLLPASTGTVGSTPSTGINRQADRISQINTGV